MKIQDVQLKQQPNTKSLGIKNMGDCCYRAWVNDNENDIPFSFGNLFMWDMTINGFECGWKMHVYNMNEDETIIYDSFDNIKNTMTALGMIPKRPINEWKVGLIDGSLLGNDYEDYHDQMGRIAKKLDKKFSDYDAIYVFNLAYDETYTRLTFEDIEDILSEFDQVENWDTYIKRKQEFDGIVEIHNGQSHINKTKFDDMKFQREQELKKQFPNATIYVV